MTIRQQWVLSIAAGLVVAMLCLIDLGGGHFPPVSESVFWAFLILVAVAIATARLAPGVALLAGWGAGLLQIFGGIPPSLAEVALVVVLFCAARWGHPVTVLAAGLTVPAAPLLAYLTEPSSLLYSAIGRDLLLSRGLAVLTFFALAALGVPWLLGLTVRFLARATRAQEAQHTAEEQAGQAQEIARLREEQNRLARDVHDVVGHSLAVILAQAESGQFLDDGDRLKETMANIATSARSSLRDVRTVLSPDARGRSPVRLEELIDGLVDAGGRRAEVEQIGDPRPLPPELEQVAYRVLQEMLTNALKYGDREQPLQVELAWPEEGGLADSLRIEVRNGVDVAALVADGSGSGLDGMRRRLASVGGHLDVRRRESDHGPTFTATAWVPVRHTGGADDER